MRRRSHWMMAGTALVASAALVVFAFAATESSSRAKTSQVPAGPQFSMMMENMSQTLHAMSGQAEGAWTADGARKMADHMRAMAEMMGQLSGMMTRMQGAGAGAAGTQAGMGHSMGMMGAGRGSAGMGGGMMMGPAMQSRMGSMERRMATLMQACGVQVARK